MNPILVMVIGTIATILQSSTVNSINHFNSISSARDVLAEPNDIKLEVHQSVSPRQGRDYSPPSAISPPIQSSYSAPAPASYAPASSYGSPSYGTPMVMHGGYGVPSHYAIPPIVMGSGGYSDDDYGGGGGSDYKELLALLGIKGLKGLKGLKAAKAVKGLGLLALSPILLPLLLLAPILLLLPLLLPLLLLLLIPIPVVAIPGGRRKRSAKEPSIFEDTLMSLMSHLPPSITSIPPAQLAGCLDNFVCQSGDLVRRTAPSLIEPASWFLISLWPNEMHSKIKIFQNPIKCAEKYRCKVKELDHLFNNVVYRESIKLRHRLREKVGDKQRVNWADLVRIIFE